MGRKVFDRQFKIAAVKLVLEDEIPVTEAAKALSIHYNSLYRWINEYEEYGESAFPGHGSALYNSQFEIPNTLCIYFWQDLSSKGLNCNSGLDRVF